MIETLITAIDPSSGDEVTQALGAWLCDQNNEDGNPITSYGTFQDTQ